MKQSNYAKVFYVKMKKNVIYTLDYKCLRSYHENIKYEEEE